MKMNISTGWLVLSSLEGLLKFGLSQADINMAPSLNLRNGLMQDLNMPYGSLRETKTQ